MCHAASARHRAAARHQGCGMRAGAGWSRGSGAGALDMLLEQFLIAAGNLCVRAVQT